ncbi:MAG: vWA domain-containing protein, partial [Tepidisphaeraceae bacterium]
TGIGSGAGSGTGPGTGSGVGGGSGSGTGPGTGSGSGPGLGGVLDEMKTKGLDVVFILDASASMLPYIEQSKKRLHQIVAVVNSLVHGAKVTEGVTGKSGIRFGIVAFKDYGDEYGIEATRALPLTADIAKLKSAIDEISAGGGGDIPEPLHDALRAATAKSIGWSRQRKSVIVMVTDAPCHGLGRQMAMEEARAFAKQIGGQINVIDVGGVIETNVAGTATTTQPAAVQRQARTGILPDLQAIAREGGGSAFLLQDDQAFWRHLIVSIFGQRFEQDIQQIIDTYVTQPPK